MPTPTHTIKQGDTGPPIRATLTGADNTPQDLTGASVAFNLRTSAGVVVIDHGTCTVVGDATEGVVEYAWQAADTVAPGTYYGEFEVTFADETIITFPNASNIQVKIVKQVA